MHKPIFLFAIFLLTTTNYCFGQEANVSISGEMKKWHKVTLSFEGPDVTENDEDNPFLNYRLNVTFKNADKMYTVPGFYAADGNSANTSSKSGRIWQVRFSPDEIGEWTYKASFRKGKNIAIDDDLSAGEAVAFNDVTGSFSISKSDKQSSHPRAKGRLQYVGERYLRFVETNKPFLKGGAGSPESFLAYYEFDQTPESHKYLPHAKDWNEGDPTWQNGNGKNIIGGVNYLASKGVNSVFFLTMNVQGDGNDVWPWTNRNERYRFDCSKLDQWEILFEHMDELDIMLHIVTQETENELLLDIGQLGVQRKLYYRELIARFAHHLKVTWNLGEENGPVHWSPKGQDDDDRRAMAKYIKENDTYKNFVALHTHSMPSEQDEVLDSLLEFEYLDGPSIQIHSPNLVHETTLKWIDKSVKTERAWVVNVDEIGPADIGAKPDADDPGHDEVRGSVLWGNLMAGGAGVEWYFGYKFAHMDLNLEDWRSRDELWDLTGNCLDFFHDYLPFTEMLSADGLTENKEDYVFAKIGEIYAVYMPEVVETKINLFGSKGKFSVEWYNPREGGKLQKGSVKQVKGGDMVSIGFPPNREKDWVALLKVKKAQNHTALNLKPGVIALDALSDFQINIPTNNPFYYRDEANGVLAIDASITKHRNQYANASTIFKGETGLYKATFVSITENDGESDYIIRLNGSVVDTILNTETNETYSTIRHELNKIFLHKNDIIQISSRAVTNGKIPEHDETAWSRGRWSTLLLIPDNLSIKEQLKDTIAFEEANGLLKVEAEAFHHNTNNGTKRDWYVRSQKNNVPLNTENITNHSQDASGNAYIESLPDTRTTHDDMLIHGENFFPIAGVGGIVSYKVKINSPGKYFVWASAFSTGTEDNGVHVGINGTWPESGARMQWCDDKDKWAWSSSQRMPENHCGTPNTIFLNFPETGEYIISFSMREDGFEMDRWILTQDPSFKPE